MAIDYTPFFDQFPKVDYNINGKLYPDFEKITNIFFRVGVIREVLNNISSYYDYKLEDGETPELIAGNVYNDTNAGWMIIYANKVFDPQFDWMLPLPELNKYIANKYGSIEYAQTRLRHVEKVVQRHNSTTDTTTESVHIISLSRLTDKLPNVPFDYWAWNIPPELHPDMQVNTFSADDDDNKADWTQLDITSDMTVIKTGGGISTRQTVEKFVVDGDVITQTTFGRPVSYYDYEHEMNEKKRTIKVIRPQYYTNIMQEFQNLTNNKVSFYRGLK